MDSGEITRQTTEALHEARWRRPFRARRRHFAGRHRRGGADARGSRPTEIAPRDAVAELWHDPGNIAATDLRWGPRRQGAGAVAPTPSTSSRASTPPVTARLRRGRSAGPQVGRQDRRRRAARGDGQPPAVGGRLSPADRLLRARMEDEERARSQRRSSGRFRLGSDHDTDGDWSWTENPFLGTREFKGLVVANLILNNWDLKPSQNRIYTRRRPDGPARWFVVQDIGASFGKTAWPIGNRNNIDDFETPAARARRREWPRAVRLSRAPQGIAREHHAGRRGLDLPAVRHASPTRSGTICFAAPRCPQEIGDRYIRKIKSKIQEGLALQCARRATR